MQTFDGAKLLSSVGALSNFVQGIAPLPTRGNAVESEIHAIQRRQIDDACAELEKLELNLSLISARKVRDILYGEHKRGPIKGAPGEWVTYDPSASGTLRHFVIELQDRLRDELSSRTTISLPAVMAPYLEQKQPLFGQEVGDKFPLAAEDISEAGKCLAFGRGTATVFHLMRVMECAVQRLSQKLSIPNTDREWGKLLSDIGKAIEAMPKGAERNKWSESHTHLYHVKQAWRNETMHPKQTYTPDEAKAIFEAVRVFMRDLATLA